jgi:predicted RNA binding protein YcfA (HicA-like mRNA interferase family)
MKAISGKELCRILEQNGWILLKVSRSHHKYWKPENPARIIVPVHGNTSLKKGILRGILQTADLLDKI